MKNFKVLYKTPLGLHFKMDGQNLFIDWRTLGEALLSNHLRETLTIAESCGISPSSMLVLMSKEEIEGMGARHEQD